MLKNCIHYTDTEKMIQILLFIFWTMNVTTQPTVG